MAFYWLSGPLFCVITKLVFIYGFDSPDLKMLFGRLKYPMHSKLFLEDNRFRNGALFAVTELEEKNVRYLGIKSDMFYEGILIPLGDKESGIYPLLWHQSRREKGVSEKRLYHLRMADSDLSKKQIQEIEQMSIDDIIAKAK